jgi:hypothetical protein
VNEIRARWRKRIRSPSEKWRALLLELIVFHRHRHEGEDVPYHGSDSPALLVIVRERLMAKQM